MSCFSGFDTGRAVKETPQTFKGSWQAPHVPLLPVGQATAEHYSRIAAALRVNGTPIPTNDVWIAAHAMETGAQLVSADRHFDVVEGITRLRPSA